MKIGTPLFILLTIAFVFTCVGLIVTEFRTNYPEAGVPETSFDKYNYMTNITSSITKIKDAAGLIGSDEGWWSKVKEFVASAVIIFAGLIIAIGQIVISIPFFGEIFYSVGKELGIPDTLVAIAFVSIMAGIIFMIVKFVHKGQS